MYVPSTITEMWWHTNLPIYNEKGTDWATFYVSIEFSFIYGTQPSPHIFATIPQTAAILRPFQFNHLEEIVRHVVRLQKPYYFASSWCFHKASCQWFFLFLFFFEMGLCELWLKCNSNKNSSANNINNNQITFTWNFSMLKSCTNRDNSNYNNKTRRRQTFLITIRVRLRPPNTFQVSTTAWNETNIIIKNEKEREHLYCTGECIDKRPNVIKDVASLCPSIYVFLSLRTCFFFLTAEPLFVFGVTPVYYSTCEMNDVCLSEMLHSPCGTLN